MAGAVCVGFGFFFFFGPVFGEFDIRSIENLNLLYFLLFMINQIRAFLRLSGVKVMSLANY